MKHPLLVELIGKDRVAVLAPTTADALEVLLDRVDNALKGFDARVQHQAKAVVHATGALNMTWNIVQVMIAAWRKQNQVIRSAIVELAKETRSQQVLDLAKEIPVSEDDLNSLFEKALAHIKDSSAGVPTDMIENHIRSTVRANVDEIARNVTQHLVKDV